MNRKEKEMCNIPDEILALLQKDVAEIKVALLGNDYNPTSGLIYRMNQVELENQKLKVKFERIVAYAAGAAAALTIIANIVVFFFEKVILK